MRIAVHRVGGIGRLAVVGVIGGALILILVGLTALELMS
jgi:hypothetical protein